MPLHHHEHGGIGRGPAGQVGQDQSAVRVAEVVDGLFQFGGKGVHRVPGVEAEDLQLLLRTEDHLGGLAYAGGEGAVADENQIGQAVSFLSVEIWISRSGSGR